MHPPETGHRGRTAPGRVPKTNNLKSVRVHGDTYRNQQDFGIVEMPRSQHAAPRVTPDLECSPRDIRPYASPWIFISRATTLKLIYYLVSGRLPVIDFPPESSGIIDSKSTRPVIRLTGPRAPEPPKVFSYGMAGPAQYRLHNPS